MTVLAVLGRFTSSCTTVLGHLLVQSALELQVNHADRRLTTTTANQRATSLASLQRLRLTTSLQLCLRTHLVLQLRLVPLLRHTLRLLQTPRPLLLITSRLCRLTGRASVLRTSSRLTPTLLRHLTRQVPRRLPLLTPTLLRLRHLSSRGRRCRLRRRSPHGCVLLALSPLLVLTALVEGGAQHVLTGGHMALGLNASRFTLIGEPCSLYRGHRSIKM